MDAETKIAVHEAECSLRYKAIEGRLDRGQKKMDLSKINQFITHHFSDGLYAKESKFFAGMMILKHTHDFSHLSILAQGKVVVLKGDDADIVEAPACIEIKAGVVHGVKAITDCVWFCIHATDEKDPSKVDEILIKGE